MKKGFIVLIFSILLFPLVGKPQSLHTDSLISKTKNVINELLYKTQDTAYIRDYSEELALMLISQVKLNSFGVWDRASGNSIWYWPENRNRLGVGMSYKWLNLELSFSIDPFNRNDEDALYFDFLASIFTRKDFIEASFQYYNRYDILSYRPSLPVANSARERPDIRTINMGLQFYHVINYDKFSLRAPFMMTQLQRRSAGSFIAGASFSFFVMDADSSIVPFDLQSSFNPNANLRDLNVFGISGTFGYMHTFVWKEHFFLTLSLMPGLSLSAGDFLVDERFLIRPNLSLTTKTMNAIGYNSRRFFTGLQFIGDFNALGLQPQLSSIIGKGRFKYYLGWRFKNREK